MRTALLSSDDTLFAADLKTTKRPEGEMSAESEGPLAPTPAAPVARLTREFAAAARSRTKTFVTALLSSVDRLLALDSKATRFPSPEIVGLNELSFAPAPLGPGRRLTSVVVLATRSRTKMFTKVLSSSIDRLSATDWKTTNRPSSEMSGWFELPFAPAPPGPDARLTRLVVLATRSRTKMFVVTLLSSGDRLSASDSNTTKRPLPEIAGSWEAAPAAAAPLAPVARLTKMVSLVAASRTKTSRNVLSSSAEMLSASVSKATWSPFAEIEETIASALTGAPAGPVAREMRTTSSLAANAGAASAAMPAAARAMRTSCGRRGERRIMRLRPLGPPGRRAPIRASPA